LQFKPAQCEFPENVSVAVEDTVVYDDFKGFIGLDQYKDTHHVGTGYFADSDLSSGKLPPKFPMKNIFPMILNAFQINTQQSN